jgi:DNA polymerase I-like protein with 3'-5' exonuclease and polymerase domains
MAEQLSLLPESELWALPRLSVAGYRAPTKFPPIKSAKRISLDLETQGLDPLRGGYIVGVTVKTDDGFQEYYPTRHKGGPNCDEAVVLRWLKDQLHGYTGEIVGANSNLFDAFFLLKAGITADSAKWRDVQWAEALLDEYAISYRLEAIAQKYLSEGKTSDVLIEKYGENVKEHFSEVHPGHASPYALVDVDLALRTYEKQIPALEADELTALFDLECRLTPLLNYMRERGVDVDLDKAVQLERELKTKYQDACQQMANTFGFQVNPSSPKDLARAFQVLGIKYPLTEKGNPSFKNDWLKKVKHPFAALLNEAREFEKIRGTFVEAYILNGHLNGRIHTQIHPLRRADEEGVRGTVSGRFSTSDPSLQNIPIRTELGAEIRGLFVPEFLMDWYSADYSQMEYRLLVHYALLSKCKGAEGVQKTYIEKPDIDFHQMVADLTGLDRKPAKNLNFGLCYGMGAPKLAASLGLANEDGSPKQEALDIMETYHARAPFIKEIYNKASQQAERQGYVKTILGRRCRFNLYEPRFTKDLPANIPYAGAMPLEEAERYYKGIKLSRAGTHKALNRVLQGSNADITKKAMVDIWESGLLKEGNITLTLTVHDELDGSVDSGEAGKRALDKVKQFMVQSIPLQVPTLVNAGIGSNWKEAH